MQLTRNCSVYIYSRDILGYSAQAQPSIWRHWGISIGPQPCFVCSTTRRKTKGKKRQSGKRQPSLQNQELRPMLNKENAKKKASVSCIQTSLTPDLHT